MGSSEEEMKIFRVRKNIMEMLKDRGYLVAETELAMDFKQFKEKFGDHIKREDLEISVSKRDNPLDLIYVFFPNDVKVGVKMIKQYLERMRHDNVTRGILVVQKNLTGYGKSAILEVSKFYNLEVFLEAELLVNINKHMLVPEHQVLSDAEKKALLERYHLKETQLPRIQLSDPVAKYHGLRRGQVVKIVRPSETAGRYVTYRFVI